MVQEYNRQAKCCQGWGVRFALVNFRTLEKEMQNLFQAVLEQEAGPVPSTYLFVSQSLMGCNMLCFLLKYLLDGTRQVNLVVRCELWRRDFCRGQTRRAVSLQGHGQALHVPFFPDRIDLWGDPSVSGPQEIGISFSSLISCLPPCAVDAKMFRRDGIIEASFSPERETELGSWVSANKKGKGSYWSARKNDGLVATAQRGGRIYCQDRNEERNINECHPLRIPSSTDPSPPTTDLVKGRVSVTHTGQNPLCPSSVPCCCC